MGCDRMVQEPAVKINGAVTTTHYSSLLSVPV